MARPRRKEMDGRFAALLNGLLNTKGLTGNKLAAKLEVNRSTVQHWRNNETLPDQYELVSNIARILDAKHLLPELMDAAGFFLGDASTNSTQAAQQTRGTSNIPDQPIPLVGRDAEIEEVTNLIREGRLVTLWGPGGIGKTSLAIAVSSQIRNEFDEVWIVTLLEKSGGWSHQQLVQGIAGALDLRFDEGSSSKEQLVAFLQSKKILLILDSFEEALDETAILADLLDKTTHLKILVTSQVRLNLEREQQYQLKELVLPPSDCLLDELMEYPAAVLFVKSVQQRDPKFLLEEKDLSHIKHTIQLVDGFPLGLRLAAGMCSARGCESVANELSQTLERLKSEFQDMDERHRNYSALFDSAWKRLGEQERDMVTRLAIFKGGFSEEAAQQICGINVDKARPGGEESLTDILLSLVGYSFIQYDRANNRYVMYGSWRKFSEEKLDSGAKNHLRQRHAQYFLQRLEEQQQFVRNGDIEDYDQLMLEFHDISDGLSWMLDDQERQAEIRPYLDLFWELLDCLNRHQEIITLSERVLLFDMMPDRPTTRERFKAEWLLRRGVSYYKSGQLEPGKHSLIAALGELDENVELLSRGGQANKFDLARELLAQLQHRLSISFAASQDDDQNELEMKARAYDTLSQIYFFDGSVGLTEYVVLRGANLAEKAASSEELIARFYANLCIGLGLESWSRPFARHYAGLALRLASKLKKSQKAKDRATAAYVYTVVSMYEIGLCNLHEGGRLAQLAIEISKSLNRSRQYIEAAVMQINVFEFQGNYKNALKVWGEIRKAATRHGDKQAIRWADAGIAEECLNLGIDVGDDFLGEQRIFAGNASLLETVIRLIKKKDESILANLRSLLAIIYLRNDMPAGATKILQEDLRLIGGGSAKNEQVLRLTDFSGYSGTAEVALRLQERILRDQQGPDQEEINRAATLACSRLAHFAAVYPVADCRYLTWKGLSEFNMGKHQEARRSWRQSIARAKERKMKFEEALALYEFGRHESGQSNVRQQYLGEAFQLFREIDSQYMMMMAKSELERPTS